MKDGESVYAVQTIKQSLGQYFELIEEEDMPFLMRDTIYKYHWVVSHATVWKRKL